MKKLFLMVIGVVALLSTNVNAMSESELKTKLTKEYTINGATFKLEDSYVTQLERYLKENEISEKDADYISSKIDEAIKIVEAGKATTIKELTKSEKDKLKALAAEVSEKTEVKVTIAKGGVVTVYNTDGTVFTKVSDPIQYTNDNTVAIIASIALAVVASGIVLVKKNVLS